MTEKEGDLGSGGHQTKGHDQWRQTRWCHWCHGTTFLKSKKVEKSRNQSLKIKISQYQSGTSCFYLRLVPMGMTKGALTKWAPNKGAPRPKGQCKRGTAKEALDQRGTTKGALSKGHHPHPVYWKFVLKTNQFKFSFT